MSSPTTIRSPVIFWLLVAATLTVDATVLYWARYPERFYGLTQLALSALVYGQFSVTCIWLALGRSGSRRKDLSIAAIIAAALVSMIATTPAVESSWKVVLTDFALHAALVWIAVKAIERTPYWQRRVEQVASWSFSMMQLLVAMTVVAVLSAAVGNSIELTRTDDWKLNLAIIIGTACVPIASLLFWQLAIHWLFRLAGSLGCALLISLLFLPFVEPMLPRFLTTFYLIQALVVSVWLGIGPIIPRFRQVGDEVSLAKEIPTHKA